MHFLRNYAAVTALDGPRIVDALLQVEQRAYIRAGVGGIDAHRLE